MKVSNSHRASKRIVYSASLSGHRRSYLETLSVMFNLTPLTGKINFSTFCRFVRTEQLFLSTIDENIPQYLILSISRSLIGKSTTALFLRPQSCFGGKKFTYVFKRLIFETIIRIPTITIASITPFEVRPEYSKVSSIGVCDPQYWDCHDGVRLHHPVKSALSKSIEKQAAGRKILCAIGTASHEKGLDFLADALERHTLIIQSTYVVCAGNIPGVQLGLKERLANLGVKVIDRYLTDEELNSLYLVADAVWCCYCPDYDQASGIFGRAIQSGVRPITREGSLVDSFAKSKQLPHLPVVYGQTESLVDALSELKRSNRSDRLTSFEKRQQLVGNWRRDFEANIGVSLAWKRNFKD